MAEAVRFSVVTPTHRRPESLQRMLAALAAQDYPFELFEVVVVADGGDRAFAAELGGRCFPFRLRAFAQDRSGPAAARNRGLAEAVEPYVLFIDDDVLPAPTLIRRHAESHQEDPDAVVIGPLLQARAVKPLPWTRWEWATLMEQYDAMQAGKWAPTPRQFYTGNASVKADHVRAVGGFDTSFKRGEDVELAWRLQARGLRFVFNPLAQSEHIAERSFDAWLGAAFEYGRSDVMMERVRTGGDLPDWVQPEFHDRHRLTQLLTRAVLAQPGLWPAVAAAGHAATRATGRVGGEGLSMQICSAMFTAAYWRGVAAMLGRPAAAALTGRRPRSVPPEAFA